ncbi:N-acetylmuramoyl-L-alanine amidase [Paenibacillus sp. ACRRX]|uniref:N-acetylmuramoyl-L-alanine amidase n=1 Tax=Paenibacillus sp. ACRRX TaxID=2918206 RepID=UPI001EF51E32|nr:N-acetylmuramoyl-L-alanine amidase [Paenibacillus sp. ACRRX]MCG7408669.1 N-acetylmuramoyl-L-alanine amidase [Paenibacillus sp. ACRRX]
MAANKIVVWDPGHGGTDSGAVGNGLSEKDITLRIATEAAKRLMAQYIGVTSYLTRSTDVFVELSARTDMANAAKAALMVSIHCNSGGGAGGFESYTYSGTSDNMTAYLQNVLHGETMTQLKPFSVIDRGQKKADFHMLRESKMPAVLTENLFVDVASDAAKLKNPAVIDALVNGHVLGVAKVLGLIQKPTDPNAVTIAVDGQVITPGININGTTYAPVRAVAESLGATVSWNQAERRVDIKTT